MYSLTGNIYSLTDNTQLVKTSINKTYLRVQGWLRQSEERL
jgi:hypothetical protein